MNITKNSLLCVKSIITLIVILTLAALVIIDKIQGNSEYKEIFTIVVTSVTTFYFSHQTDKAQNKNGKGDQI